ncbi:MAG: magnesium-translocating P-type ATPase [Clostridiaceae bacterium]|nr:magnesium-translocating P-type ATPase [Clostridiaceae bacterium]
MKFLKKNQNNQTYTYTQEQNLRRLSTDSLDDVLREFGSTAQGLTAEEAKTRLEEHGPNIAKTKKQHTVISRIIEALVNPFNIILLIIAIVTYITDVVIADTADYATTLIVLLMVFLSSVVAFIQSRNSDKAAEGLKQMVANKTDVIRDGKLVEINIADVVPGDVIKFSAGDMIPADVRFISTKDTFVSQAALTGESAPVEKFDTSGDPDVALTDLVNIGMMGTDLVSGTAIAVVLYTGQDTFFSSIATSLSGEKAQTSFERGVASVSAMLIKMMLIIIPVIFLINGIIKGDWFSALLFSVSIAVGLTPEMLPVIMTSTLARGALAMSKRNVIVRTLGSIQTFGEMDILCTDKTGTLTEDKIVLEKYMDLTGQDDTRVLRHAYLNSYFQTGLKNLIDIAIINRAEKYNFPEIIENYTRIDEVPFDFSRRRMSVILEDKTGKRQLITKGAVEEMLAICSFVEIAGQVRTIGEDERKLAMTTYEKYNNTGLRMLAVAQKNEVPDEEHFTIADESNMVLIGFVGFLDPPKESARGAVEILREHGVRTVVLTGDSEGVALKVCEKVGIDVQTYVLGTDVEQMSDLELKEVAQHCNLFSKLSPMQKKRVVSALQEDGHTVGYMGDGINDTPALRQSDVGISVDSAVDIAKETADIILLEKDLMVLEEGVLLGRRTFGNIMKYIKMAASGNFGNMIAVVIASIFLPFLPMLPVHILTQNLLNDFAQMGLAFDNMDEDFVQKPQKWDVKSLKSFMWIMGPLSSIFDVLCYIILWFEFGYNSMTTAPYFQTGWFLFGTLSQILIIHMIRTGKMPFVHSKPAPALLFSTLLVGIVALIIGLTPLATVLDLKQMPLHYLFWLCILLTLYSLSVQIIKKIYQKHIGPWI